MVVCCPFWCQSIGDVSPYECSYYFSSVRLLNGHLLGNSCSLFLYLTIFNISISRFGFYRAGFGF